MPKTKKVIPMTAASWYNDAQNIAVGKFNICVKRSPKSSLPHLILLHGFPTCSFDWYKVWPRLTEHFQLTAFDFLGFGKSDKPYPHNYSILEQADITLEIMNHLDIDNPYLMAHDYAVSVVQEIITRIGEGATSHMVQKIILLNGGLFPETHRARPIQKLLLGPFGRIVNMLLSKKSLQKNMNQIFGPQTPPSDEEIEELWKLINYNKGKRVFHLLIRYIIDRKQNRERWVDAMHNSQIPIRLVNGPIDPVSGQHMVDRYKEIFKGSDPVILENIGHYPNLEAPEAVSLEAISYFR